MNNGDGEGDIETAASDFPPPIATPSVTDFFSYERPFCHKLDTTGGDANEFAHGRGDEKFMNLAFSFNPALLRVAPYSTLGMGFVFCPLRT